MNLNPSEVNQKLESLKNFPLQQTNSAESSNFGNLPNLNADNPLESPDFKARKTVENFASMDSNPMSSNFGGSNNIKGDDALFGGGNNFDELKNDLGNSMGNRLESLNFAGNDKLSSNGNELSSNDLSLPKGGGFDQFNDNIDQRDGSVGGGEQLTSNFDAEDESVQSRMYASPDDMWNDNQYDSMSNYDFPNSYYDESASNSWMMEDYAGYRRLVFDT